MSEQKRNHLERSLSDDEAERVLERAARLQLERANEGHSAADLKASAAEVGIDPALIDEARRLLAREDEEARAKEQQKEQQKRKARRLIRMFAAFDALLIVGTILFTHVSLNDRLAEVEQKKAQLENVLDRRRALVPELLSLARAQALHASERAKALEALAAEVKEGDPLSRKLDADQRLADGMRALQEALVREASAAQAALVTRVADEMAGAHNRISVERQRYDQAASEYNRAARSFPRSWFRPLTGLPKSVPLSNGEGG